MKIGSTTDRKFLIIDPMDHSLVMTVLGPDRPGLLAKLAETIDAHGGSWFESRLARFAGHFAGILRFDCHDEQHDELLDALNQLDDLNIQVVREVEVGERVTKRLSFDILGNHRPGFMKQIATAITKVGGNIVELSSERDLCPRAGHILFRAVGTVDVVDDFNADEIVKVLQSLGSDLSVTVMPESDKLEAQLA